MGYSDGGFWRFYERNNDTYPFVMASPKCTPEANRLWECQVKQEGSLAISPFPFIQGFADPEQIPLSENLCQGEDDIGIYCWGMPTFRGWAKHWKGLGGKINFTNSFS
jgi:hypothetical protein